MNDLTNKVYAIPDNDFIEVCMVDSGMKIAEIQGYFKSGSHEKTYFLKLFKNGRVSYEEDDITNQEVWIDQVNHFVIAQDDD